MQIDLPPEAIALANSMATDDKNAAVVIAEALAQVAWQRQEAAAAMEGVADHQAGRSRPYEEFMAEFMGELGVTPER